MVISGYRVVIVVCIDLLFWCYYFLVLWACGCLRMVNVGCYAAYVLGLCRLSFGVCVRGGCF